MKLSLDSRGRRPAGRAAGALLGLALLAGCGQLAPGTAASVNGKQISMSQVRDLADAQCVAAERESQGQSTSMPMSQVQQRSLGLLLETELTKQYARDAGIKPDPQVVDAFWSQYRDAIEALPDQTGDVLGDAFHNLAVIRALLVQAGSRSTGQPPSMQNLQDLTQAGLEARKKWVDDADVHTDARFAPDADGYPGAGNSSVSQPVSDFAKGASSQEADPAWVAGLPASQKCG